MTVRAATDTDRTVARNVAMLRKAKGLSQTDLGNAIGVTYQQVQKYENGKNRVSSSRLQMIASILAVPISTFYSGEESKDPSDAWAFLAQLDASELLTAYCSIGSEQVRRDVLNMVRTVTRFRARCSVSV